MRRAGTLMLLAIVVCSVTVAITQTESFQIKSGSGFESSNWSNDSVVSSASSIEGALGLSPIITVPLQYLAAPTNCSVGTGTEEWYLINGDTSYYQGDYNSAIEYYTEATRWGGASSYFNRGNAYYQLGNLPKAITDYKTSLSIDPSLKGAKNNLYVAINKSVSENS